MAMNETERMLREINGLLGAMGNKPIQVTLQGPVPELTLLRVVKQEYKARLLDQVPAYRAIPSDAAIPDLFLQALQTREVPLEGRSP